MRIKRNKGAGRPKQFDKLKQIGVHIEQIKFDAIKKISEEKGTTASSVFREAVDFYLDNRVSVEITNVSPEVF